MTNTSKINKTLNKILKVINKNNLNIPELILLVANLTIAVGKSLSGVKGEIPNTEDLQRLYYTDPTVDVQLMLQGKLMVTWANDFVTKKPKLSNLGKSMEK